MGGFSTVWLARDILLETWVALKIEMAEKTIPSRELLNLQSICQHTKSDRVAHLVDSFIHEGPNGSHQCTVTELLGPSINSVVADYDTGDERLSLEIILKITRQLLEAIHSLHQAGYAHGDISGVNVVFTASQLSHLSEDALLDIIGHPKSAAVIRIDGRPVDESVPKQLVGGTEWDSWIEEDEEDIKLIDWGESFQHRKEPAHLGQPVDLKAPETIFTSNFDYRVDLWRAGCVIYTLLFAARPFHYFHSEAVLISQMIGFVEELPPQWQQKWEEIKAKTSYKPVHSSPHLGNDIGASSSPQASKLQSKFHEKVHEPELMPLLPIISGLMRFLPSNRLTAAEALELLGQPGSSKPDDDDEDTEEKDGDEDDEEKHEIIKTKKKKKKLMMRMKKKMMIMRRRMIRISRMRRMMMRRMMTRMIERSCCHLEAAGFLCI